MYIADTNSWYLERVIRLIAGVMVLLGLLLAVLFSKWFLIITFLVGFNLTVFAITGFCPMAVLLVKFGVKPKR